MELRDKLSNKNSHLYWRKKWQFLFESFSRSSILLYIVENWRTKCQWHKKFEGPGPAPPTPPVFRVILLRTEASGKILFRGSIKVYVTSYLPRPELYQVNHARHCSIYFLFVLRRILACSGLFDKRGNMYTLLEYLAVYYVILIFEEFCREF